MLKVKICLFISVFSAISLIAQQNLVPNPSFENDGGAPVIEKYNWHYFGSWKRDSLSEHNKNVLIKGWFQPTQGSPDYLNSDQSALFGFSTQTARTGKGRFGIIAGIGKNSFNSWLLHEENYSEYIETKLVKPLEKGKTYCIRYYVSLDKRSHFACEDFGAIVSSTFVTAPSYNGTLKTYTDNDVLIDSDNHFVTSDEGWKMICITFVANGGEQFLTIGSFMDEYAKNRHKVKSTEHRNLRWMANCKFAYYYFDDVSLTEVQPGEPLCEIVKDTVARNNLVMLLDVSGSMKQKNFIDSVRISTMEFLNTLNPTDLVSIIAFHSDTQILVSAHPAGDTAFIRKAFESIRSGGATNIGLALQAAYGQIRKNPLAKGNNSIILITDGRVHISSDLKKMMKTASEKEGISFSIIFRGKLVPDEMEKLAAEMNGTALAAAPTEAAKAMQSQTPSNEVMPTYNGRQTGRIITWHVLTKVFFPVILVGMLLVKLMHFN
ncbi:hypothetical protein BH09BAC5_BH09BAC5_00640 [soil metagenome]